MRIPVAVAQFQPEVLNLETAVEKTCAIIDEARKSGVHVVAFPETWLTVYPFWVDQGRFSVWGDAASKDLFHRMRENALDLRSQHCERLRRACARAGVAVVLGVNERVEASRTMYNTLLLIDDDGSVPIVHRKLVPTFGERLVWGTGDGSGLHVHPTASARVGGLICWEHWMPLARQILHEQGEELHIAQWPHCREIHQLASRHYAFEGRCFVLSAGMLLEKRNVPSDFELLAELRDLPDVLLPGGSFIAGPDGALLTQPLFDREALIIAEIDTAECARESLTLDVAGHTSRPDVFRLTVTPSGPETALPPIGEERRT